jgi:hypothetical protein
MLRVCLNLKPLGDLKMKQLSIPSNESKLTSKQILKTIKNESATVNFYFDGTVEVFLDNGYSDSFDVETVAHFVEYYLNRLELNDDDFEVLAEKFADML